MPDITLYFLQASRSIRIAWLLEELGLDYKLEFSDRQANRAPEEFKEKSGNPTGKFPAMRDGDLCVYESGAMVDYLVETYDKSHKMLPTSQPERVKAQIWAHASEGTFMMHALPVLYSRFAFPQEFAKSNPEVVDQLGANLGGSVVKDLDWLESELEKGKTTFLVGNTPTIADIMMTFTIDAILDSGMVKSLLDTKRPKVEQWREACHNTETYKKAVAKTGHVFPAPQ